MLNFPIVENEIHAQTAAQVTSLARIVLLAKDNLFDLGLGMLLAARKDLEVFHANAEDTGSLMETIQKIQPEVLVMCEPASGFSRQLLQQVEELAGFDHLRVIVVSLNSNSLEVRDRGGRYRASQLDFFSLLHPQA